MAEDVDYMAVASMTDGMVGAELANIVEVAAINMMRDGRTEVLHTMGRENFFYAFVSYKRMKETNMKEKYYENLENSEI